LQGKNNKKQVTKGATHVREIVAMASKGNLTTPSGMSDHNNTGPTAFLDKGLSTLRFKKDDEA